MDSDTDIRFSLVFDMYGNVVTSKHREGEDNFLSEDETRDAVLNSAESWRNRKNFAKKIGEGKYALVEYEKICRITIPLADDRMLLVTADNNGSPMKIIEPILNQISHPKL